MQCCDDEHKENALDFTAWLRDNKIPPMVSRSSPYLWEAKYKNKTLYTLSVNHAALSQGDWGVGLHLANMDNYSELIANEGLQEIIWNGTSYCAYGERNPYFGMAKAPGCNPKKHCIPGKTINILGKDIGYCCVGANGKFVRHKNPDDIIIKAIKRLLELEKKTRDKVRIYK